MWIFSFLPLLCVYAAAIGETNASRYRFDWLKIIISVSSVIGYVYYTGMGVGSRGG